MQLAYERYASPLLRHAPCHSTHRTIAPLHGYPRGRMGRPAHLQHPVLQPMGQPRALCAPAKRPVIQRRRLHTRRPRLPSTTLRGPIYTYAAPDAGALARTRLPRRAWRARYAEAHGIAYSPYSDYAITVAELEAVAAFQGTDLRPGDVLLVRTGWTDAMTGKSGRYDGQVGTRAGAVTRWWDSQRGRG